MPRKNVIAAIGFLLFGAVYGYLTTGLIERTLPNTPGPSFLPWLLVAALVALSASLLAQGLISSGGGEVPDSGGDAPAASPLAGLAVFAVYLAALPFLGFLLASVPFFGGLMLVSGERRIAFILVAALAVPVFLYSLFAFGFQIPMPSGSLVDW